MELFIPAGDLFQFLTEFQTDNKIQFDAATLTVDAGNQVMECWDKGEIVIRLVAHTPEGQNWQLQYHPDFVLPGETETGHQKQQRFLDEQNR